MNLPIDRLDPLDHWSHDQEPLAADPVAEPSRLHSVSIPAPDLTTEAMISASGGPRFLWLAPGAQRDQLSGCGIAAELTTPVLLGVPGEHDGDRFAAIRTQVDKLFAGSKHLVVAEPSEAMPIHEPSRHPARPRLLGGFAFSPAFVPDNTWSVFHPAHFILPHYQLTDGANGRWLTINAVASPEDDPAELESELLAALVAYHDTLRHLSPSAESANTMPGAADRAESQIRYPMSPDQWERMVSQGVAAIHEGQLGKVVLSRVGELRTGDLIQPAAVVEKLSQDYPECYRFLFEPVAGHVFLGATPELLVRLSDDKFESMALAGSIRRGRTAEEDAALRAELLATPKERHEHELVVAEVASRLSAVASPVNYAPEPGVLPLKNIQHLHTPFAGHISDRKHCDILTLAELLHPTPALGGTPVQRALEFLANVEPVPRGWYAAPIGWLDAKLDGEFAVAIRSAVCQHDRAWLFAGAGIMADSIAAKEWNETELKFKPMLNALTQSGQ